MKKRLIALALVLCMVLSIIPVYATDGSAGKLVLDTPVSVTLNPGEEVFYTFDAKGDVRYYYYITPDPNASFGNIEIRPEGDGQVSGSGSSYSYSGTDGYGTIFRLKEDCTARIFLRNHDSHAVTFNVAVTETKDNAASMTLNETSLVLEQGESEPLLAMFLPLFSYADDLEFEIDDPSIADIEQNTVSADIIAQNAGPATITAKANGGALTATCTLQVVQPTNVVAIDFNNGAQVTSTTPGECNEQMLSFTAPANGRYIIHTAEKAGVYMVPVGVCADNFTRHENALVIYENLTAGETVYIKYVNESGEGTSDIYAVAGMDAPQFAVTNKKQQVAVGESFYCDTEFDRVSEYTPVEWNTDQPHIVKIDASSPYAAEFIAVDEGTATITATTKTANPVTVSWTVEVGNGGNSAPATQLQLDGWADVTIDQNGEFTFEYTPVDGGVYFIGWFHEDEIHWVDCVSVNKYCDHDQNYWDPDSGDRSICGGVWPLDPGVTYTFKGYTPNGDRTFSVYTCRGPVTDEITARETEVIGYVGTMAELYYDIAPAGSFCGLEFTSSDDSVATFFGGNNADPFGHFALLKAGTATITATTASGLKATTKITVLDAPKIELNKSITVDVAPYERVAYTFTAPKSGMYSFTADGTYDQCSLMLSRDDCFMGSFYSGSISGMWWDMQAGESVTVIIENPCEPQNTYTLNVVKTPKATGISLPDWTVYTSFGGFCLRADTDPVTAYEEIASWKVSDPSVMALMGSYGNEAYFELLKPGKVTVTAISVNGFTASCTVEVKEPGKAVLGQATTVTLTDKAPQAFYTFTAPKDGYYFIENDIYSFADLSADADMSVSTEKLHGHWKYLNKGDIWNIEVCRYDSYNGMDCAYTFQVKDATAPITSIVMKPVQNVFDLGSYYAQINLDVAPLLSYDLEDIQFSDPSVVEDFILDGYTLYIYPAKAGTTDVTLVTSKGVTGKCTITFQNDEKLVLDKPTAVNLDSNGYRTFKFDVVAGKEYFFYSNDPRVYTGLRSGSAETVGYSYEIAEDKYYDGFIYKATVNETITICVENYSHENRSVSVCATEVVKPTQMKFYEENLTLYVGQNYDVGVEFSPTFAYDGGVTYKITGDAVSENSTCQYYMGIYAEKVGTVTITASTASGLQATCTVTVVNPDGTFTAGKDTAVTLQKDQTKGYQFTAPETGYYDFTVQGLFDIQTHTGKDNWFGFGSGQPNFYLEKGESALITLYSDRDVSGVVNIHKRTKPINSITLHDVNGVVDGYGKMEATFAPADGYLSGYLDWFVEDTSIAEITNYYYNGVALEFKKPGTTTLKLRYMGKTYTSTITVGEAIVLPADNSKPATVTPEALEMALKDALDDVKSGETAEVVISVTDLAKEAGMNISKVELPIASLDAIAEAEAVLTIELSAAKVTLDAKSLAAVAKQAEGGQVVLNLENVDVKTLNEKQQKEASKHKVAAVINAELICAATGKNLWTKDNKDTDGSITVSMPFTPEAGYTLKNYTVLFVDDDGKLEKVKTEFDEDEGNLIFTLKHFSNYIIARDYVEPATNPATGDSFQLGAMLLMMVLAVTAAAVLVFAKRRTV